METRLFLRASVATLTYAMNSGRVREIFFHIICDENLPVPLLKSTSFLQPALDNSQTMMPQLHYHTIALMIGEIVKKNQKMLQNSFGSTSAIIGIQLLQKVSDTLTTSSPLVSLHFVGAVHT